jgi:hypothetical protein
MNSDQFHTTESSFPGPFPTGSFSASRGERLTHDPYFAGSWRPLSTDPAVIVPVLGSPVRRKR